jgi:hypothetical protein
MLLTRVRRYEDLSSICASKITIAMLQRWRIGLETRQKSILNLGSIQIGMSQLSQNTWPPLLGLLF